ncbi:hypothetical protein ABAC460_00015 [Asticcacaulis sp. AC460]|uniref:response regulator n=1 Tax=Asticcacaulis sp. AC460 TaxID=1282360 RepID=UPI0003C3FADB|nr:response regulator [Asticcacaulis sp. AC460]ESQ93485.1 hypothetical protein ABAC460_00015 [Asticcacaulis sp. AC460]
MRALQMRYLAHVADRLESFEACVAPYDRAWLTREAHALAGSGGSFGFWDISARAGELETLLKDAPNPSDPDISDHLTWLRDAMAMALLQSETAEPGQVPAKPAPAPVPVPVPVLSSRVVIVEDDVSVRDLLSGLISATAEVFTAADTAEGRHLIETVRPDLILLDNRIGGADAGLELLDSLQAVPGLKDIPVIMITASDDPGEVMRALMAGAADYIVKPFDPAEVGAKIRGRLDRLGSHVLIADDDDTVREMLVHKFQSAGCKVTSVQTGAEAWDALQAGDYSVALLDRMMPGYDGVTLLRMMKADAHTAQVPVVFLTARHYGADVLEGLNTGAVDYITKPFHADEVLARVLRLLNTGEAA